MSLPSDHPNILCMQSVYRNEMNSSPLAQSLRYALIQVSVSLDIDIATAITAFLNYNKRFKQGILSVISYFSKSQYQSRHVHHISRLIIDHLTHGIYCYEPYKLYAKRIMDLAIDDALSILCMLFKHHCIVHDLNTLLDHMPSLPNHAMPIAYEAASFGYMHVNEMPDSVCCASLWSHKHHLPRLLVLKMAIHFHENTTRWMYKASNDPHAIIREQSVLYLTAFETMEDQTIPEYTDDGAAYVYELMSRCRVNKHVLLLELALLHSAPIDALVFQHFLSYAPLPRADICDKHKPFQRTPTHDLLSFICRCDAGLSLSLIHI